MPNPALPGPPTLEGEEVMSVKRAFRWAWRKRWKGVVLLSAAANVVIAFEACRK